MFQSQKMQTPPIQQLSDLKPVKDPWQRDSSRSVNVNNLHKQFIKNLCKYSNIFRILHMMEAIVIKAA